MKAYLQPILGGILFVGGTITTIIPIIPFGFVFAIAGIILLTPYVPFLNWLLSYIERKDKSGTVEKAQNKVNNLMRDQDAQP